MECIAAASFSEYWEEIAPLLAKQLIQPATHQQHRHNPTEGNEEGHLRPASQPQRQLVHQVKRNLGVTVSRVVD